ncbi:BamA/OMP85 family outer membrane protein [Arachidicoccus soli]|uniref:Outer membrane protein assembly factor n=1 Tax=Arachidicoccus soli TaxID=2341117 RepID=A0A386HKP1_9BACT|nr:POTRA domain-containing protein [Arachidicoccus soli]AYD46283.1 outer membrane protein assembly factor [Arachidicoccus soli]
MRKSTQLICVLVILLFGGGSVQAQINTVNQNTTKQVLSSSNGDLQTVLNQINPQRYKIAGITVTGNKVFDTNLLISSSGLSVGSYITIPGGDELSRSIHRLWVQNYFSDITYYLLKVEGSDIYIELNVTERPRVSKFYFKGVSKTQSDDLKSKSGIVPGHVITDNMKMTAVDAIRKYFSEKGFRRVSVDISEKKDSSYQNSVVLYFDINKGEKVKVGQIELFGNENMPGHKLKKQMKGTKEVSRLTLYPLHDTFDTTGWGTPYKYTLKDYVHDHGYLTYTKTRNLISPYVYLNPFASSKFDEKKYAEDKQKIIDYYNSKGYRDAQIVRDSVFYNSKGNLNVDIKLKEGHKYYFGNVSWVGNTVYSDSLLSAILDIRKGDTYNRTHMNERLGLGNTPSSDGVSVMNLYLDNGYLFFNVTPVEVKVYNDTIDYVMNLREGPEATIKRVNIAGNDKTNEHVIRRALRTLPGDKFSRSDIMNSIRELSVLKFFDEQKINPVPTPNETDGTVDLTYNLVEKSSDQLQLSAGFGGGIGLTGTLGVTFNNFSLKNIFNKKGWSPLPTGDGQTLSLNFQSNGKAFRSYNAQFVEPWLGGKHQNALSLSFSDSKFTNGYNYLTGRYDSNADTTFFRTTSIGVGLSKQLKWPDPYFSFGLQLNYTRYKLHNYYIDQVSLPNFRNGASNDINLRITLSRSSVNSLQYPTGGSNISMYAQLTPPYSSFDPSIAEATDPAKKYKFIEYQKYRFTGDWYVPIGPPHGDDKKQFVFKASVKMGFLGRYNSDMPISPFQRFQLGDAGMSTTYALLGYDIISQRGYPVYETSNPRYNPDQQGASQYFTIFNKYTMELRYPLSLSQSSTIFGLVFAEAANGWYSFREYNPFQLRRDVGVGARFYLPMFGLLGFDYGIGIDRIQQGQGIGKAGRFTFMLGYEPD